jgi:hypothetical protein
MRHYMYSKWCSVSFIMNFALIVIFDNSSKMMYDELAASVVEEVALDGDQGKSE